MRWPFVSRRAYEVVLADRDARVPHEAYEQLREECAWLRAKNDELTGHVVRMDRLEHGVAETPRKPRPDLQPMPEKLKRYFQEAFATASIAKMHRDQAYRRHARGVSWDVIEREVITEDTDDER